MQVTLFSTRIKLQKKNISPVARVRVCVCELQI